MCADASASTDFATGCEPGRVVPSSNADGARAAPGSAPSGRQYLPLRGRSAFSRISQEGKRTRRGGVVVVTAPGDPGRPQVGFVAGRRVGSAVRRNRAKRRLRAAIERLPLAEGTAYLVVAGPETVNVEFGRLVAWLEAAIGLDNGKEEA